MNPTRQWHVLQISTKLELDAPILNGPASGTELSYPTSQPMPPTSLNFLFSQRGWSPVELARIGLLFSGWMMLAMWGTLSFAAAPAVPDAEDATQPMLAIGFAQTAKLGHWGPVTLTVPAGTQAAMLELSVIDGDESPVVYSATATPMASDTGTSYQGLCRFGRRYGNLTATLVGDDGQTVLSQSINLETSGANLASSTDHLTLLLSDSQSLESNLKTTLGIDAKESDLHLVRVTDFNALPQTELGWQSVNRLIVSSASAAGLASLSPQHWEAIKRWIGSGGSLVLIADPENLALFNDTPLAQLFAPAKGQPKMLTSSRELERFVGNSRRRLINRNEPGIAFVEVSPVPADASVLLAAEDGSPLVMQAAEGFGQVKLVAFDLESERLEQWQSYQTMLEKIFVGRDDDSSGGPSKQSNEGQKAGSAVTHFGYDDITGQLRVPLDDFSTVRFIDFTLIAILIALYIICISVGDYFLLDRLVKKMELTWITFPLIALLFCGIAWGIARATRPARLQINQMEIIDIDTNEDYSRGTAWVNIYSPSGQNVDVAVSPTTAIGLDVTSSSVTWQGLPGDGLGGLETETTTGFKRTGYRQDAGDGGSNENGYQIHQMPLQVSSTRSLVSQFKIQNPPAINSQLKVQRDRLSGTLENPLDVTLYNGKVFFGNYVYLLKKPLQPGGVVYLDTDADEKTIRTVLNRRSSQGNSDRELGKTQSLPWDPRDKSLTRIADVMMFYQAAGGGNYTGLTHGYFSKIDYSHLLKLKRAVLVGQIESASSLLVNGQEVKELYDSSVTMVRVVLPVESKK